jgi:hypothetical protein
MGDVNDDYGRRVGMALKAVKQLHADASRLLSDCDGTIGKGKSVATLSKNATNGISFSLGRPWMAEGAYRCYAADPDGRPGLVDAVCLAFFGEVTETDEPLLIVGQVYYRLDEGQKLQEVCDGWDVWYLFSGNCPERTHGEVLAAGPLTWQDGGKSFDGFKLIAVPLYSINSMDGVVALMERLRAEAMPIPAIPT